MKEFQTWIDGERGRLTSIARELGIAPSAVSQWLESQIPAERIFRVSEFTGIPVKKLRPDLFDKGAAA